MATSSAKIGSTNSTFPPASSLDNVPLWEMDGPQVESWVRSVHALFPKAVSAKHLADHGDAEQHAKKRTIASKLLQNLSAALASISPAKSSRSSTMSAPPAKRIKTEQPEEEKINDVYSIWFMEMEDLPVKQGAILAQLSVASLVNALGGQAGGLVDSKNKPKNDSIKADSVLPLAENITFDQLQKYALALKHTIATRAERDVLTTTPLRIQQMLCPETEPHEFRAIRKRVYDTVILGKGLNTADEPEANVPVATKAVLHDAEKFKKCKVCQNNDQSLFVLDRKNGDVICTRCGTVAMGSLMHEGSMYRKFEGEADRNHHGDAANPLYSNAHNMSTTLGGMNITSSAGNGWGTQSRGLENVLRNAHAYTEMNISQFGEKDRRTRVGYKDRQKRDAFIQMSHVGDALNLHEAVVQRAKELFAGFRDDRELVQQFKGVVAACLCEAFEQLSRDGKQILKSIEKEEEAVVASADDSQQVFHNSRATRRSDLHSAKMAGKGGLLLDFSNVENEKKDMKVTTQASASPMSPENAVESKPAPAWDLDDCRSFLLDASKSIAKQWGEDRKSADQSKSKNIPEGTLGELEGKLVEHALTLCDQLEAELKSKNGGGGTNGSGSTNNKKVVTPRLENLGTLSIRWQHAHERGSGGKGGVGNSGRTTLGTKPGERQGKQRTAGQILILKTSKKLGAMLNDPVAGEAFHRELRALVGRQEVRKKKEMRDEAARQRFQQMKRKPWLQARAQAND